MTVEPPAPVPDPDEILAILETYPAGEARAAQLGRYAGGEAGLAQTLAAGADDVVHQDALHALRLAQAALELAEPVGQPAIIARVLRSLVQAMAALGQFEPALPLSLRAYQLYEEGGQLLEAKRTLLGRTHVLAALGRYVDAIQAAEQARQAFQQAGEELLAGIATMNLGNVYQRLDQYQAAETLYREARELFVRGESDNWLAQTDFNLGNALMHLDRPAEAGAAFARAMDFFEAQGQTVAVAMLHANLGFLELRQCRYTLALQHYQRARDAFRRLGLEKDVVQMDMEVASVYLDLNLLKEAIAAFQQAAETFQRIDLQYEAGIALAQLALAHTRLGQFVSAERALEQARQLFAKETNAIWLQTCDLYEALFHLAQENWATAYAVAIQAAEGLAEPGLAARRAVAHLTAARAGLIAGWREQTRAHLSAAASCLAELDLPTLTYQLEHWRGRLLLVDGERVAALSALEAATRAAERVRQTLPGDLLRSAYREDKLGAYQALTTVLLSEASGAQIEQAFDVIERAKALALAERMGQAPPQVRPEPDQANDLAQLRAQLNWYYSAYTDRHPESSAGNRQALREAIRGAERDWVKILMRRDLLSTGRPGADPAVLSLSETQSRLRAGEALLEYFVADGEILALLIQDKRVELYRNLGAASTIATLVEHLRAHFARRGLENQFAHRHSAQLLATTKAHLSQLYRTLVAPMTGSLPERLTIVPHGVLHYVPFHALFDGERFLIERHQVSHAPSATLWSYCQAQPARPVKSALVIAAGDERIPHVAQETEIVRGLFANARICAGAEAKWSSLRQYAPEADLVHVAAHAVFREDNALFSALHLADEWVTVNDLYELQLRSALVVLTGCETGMSQVAPGDELLGLTRAFLAAGAATLVVSLWPVHDESAAEWVGEFYRHLGAGLSPAAAVRQAQLALLRARPDPYYWAPFVTVGRA